MADESRPYPYRVFVCYASENLKILEQLLRRLADLKVCSRWSGTLHAGTPYPEQIKEEIARAHVFLPIVTDEARGKPWVHQEIGFALASNVPVLPLAVDDLPEGLAHELQAVRVKAGADGGVCDRDLEEKLTYERIDAAVRRASSRRTAFFRLAPFVEDRTRMLVEAAEWLENVGQYAKVRQWGTFTSFSLPDADYDDTRWPVCDDCKPRCNRALRRDWRRERQALVRHACAAGCDLLIDPYVIDDRSAEMRRVRAGILIDFLTKMKEAATRANGPEVRAVVIPPPDDGESPRGRGNRTLLGDWFAADSVTPLPGLGYEQTLATWHAPTVLERLREFDCLFDEHLRRAKLGGRSSIDVAIERLNELYRTPPADPAVEKKSGKSKAKRRASNGKV